MVNPLTIEQTTVSLNRAIAYCESGVAVMLPDGRLLCKNILPTDRTASDVYVDNKQFEIYIKNRRSFPHTQWIPTLRNEHR